MSGPGDETNSSPGPVVLGAGGERCGARLHTLRSRKRREGPGERVRVFVYEYTCSREWSGPEAASLRAEGAAMLHAAAADFGRIPGVEVLTLPGRAWRDVAEERAAFAEQARRAEWSF